jgi:hypothetical protein
MRPEGLGSKNAFASSGLKPVTFRLVAWYLNHYATACPVLRSHVSNLKSKQEKEIKDIPVTDRGGLLGFQMLRIQHFLDNQLTDGGKIVSFFFFSISLSLSLPPSPPSSTHFC